MAKTPACTINPLTIASTTNLNGLTMEANLDASTRTGENANLQHRYVLIPGSETGRKARYIDWNDYAVIKAYLKLAD